MIDLIWLLLAGIASATAGAIIVEVFRWGYNKEKRNERTDLWGRPNNHMSKDDMD